MSGELLDGVKDKNNPVSEQVCDFYVFLLQTLNRIERTKDSALLKTMEELLHLENETWQQVVQQSQSEAVPGSSTPFPNLDLPSSESPTDYSGGFSLEI